MQNDTILKNRSQKKYPINDQTLRDYLRAPFKYQSTIFIFVCVVLTTVYLGLQFKTPVYQAQVKMLITGEQQGAAIYYKDLETRNQKELNLTRSEIVRSYPVIKLAVDALELYKQPTDYEEQFASPVKKIWIQYKDKKLKKFLAGLTSRERKNYLYRRAIEKLRKNLEVIPIDGTKMFIVRVTDFDQQMVAKKANVISRSYIVVDLQQQMQELQLKYGYDHPTVRQISDSILKIKIGLNGKLMPGLTAVGPATVKIIEQALPSLLSVGQSRTQRLLTALFISLFIGIILSYILDSMDQTIKSSQELESLLHFPVIGTIPRKRFFERRFFQPKHANRRRSKYQQSFRRIADRIGVSVSQDKTQSIIFTAPDTGEGTTTAVVNLGYYLAQHVGLKVLLIEINSYPPCFHRIFKAKKSMTLSQVLTTDPQGLNALDANSANLKVLPFGKPNQNAMTLLRSNTMQQVLKNAKNKFDVVLIDCPSLRDFDETLILMPYVDALVLLVSEHKTRRQVIKSLVSRLDNNNSKILGTILNNQQFVIPEYFYERL